MDLRAGVERWRAGALMLVFVVMCKGSDRNGCVWALAVATVAISAGQPLAMLVSALLVLREQASSIMPLLFLLSLLSLSKCEVSGV